MTTFIFFKKVISSTVCLFGKYNAICDKKIVLFRVFMGARSCCPDLIGCICIDVIISQAFKFQFPHLNSKNVDICIQLPTNKKRKTFTTTRNPHYSGSNTLDYF